jgi:hypothetical protein
VSYQSGRSWRGRPQEYGEVSHARRASGLLRLGQFDEGSHGKKILGLMGPDPVSGGSHKRSIVWLKGLSHQIRNPC